LIRRGRNSRNIVLGFDKEGGRQPTYNIFQTRSLQLKNVTDLGGLTTLTIKNTVLLVVAIWSGRALPTFSRKSAALVFMIEK
jgi:hypothetical protein